MPCDVCALCFCSHRQLRFPPSLVVHVPVMGQAISAASLPAPSAASSAPHGVCSVHFRFYCEGAHNGGGATIGLRCFAVNGERDEELYQLQFAHDAQPFSGAVHSRSFCEWRDVKVPCRSVLEVSFTFRGDTDVYMVYVGQVPKLFIMAKAESELLRCLTDVVSEDWFRSCGPNLSASAPSQVRILVPQQFSSPRYSKVKLFDLKQELWASDGVNVFRKVATGPELSEFSGSVCPGNYRLYLWDDVYQKWMLDGCIIHIPESLMPNSAVLFGHRQDTDKETSFGQYRVMDAQVPSGFVALLHSSLCCSRHLSDCKKTVYGCNFPPGCGLCAQITFVLSCTTINGKNGIGSRHLHLQISSRRFPEAAPSGCRRFAPLGVL